VSPARFSGGPVISDARMRLFDVLLLLQVTDWTTVSGPATA